MDRRNVESGSSVMFAANRNFSRRGHRKAFSGLCCNCGEEGHLKRNCLHSDNGHSHFIKHGSNRKSN